jgi:putative FmdB family regulatory protein
MPLYEYSCETCQTRSEVRHGIDEPAPTSCPACGGTLQRIFSVPAGSTRRPWNPWGTSAPGAPTAGR